MKKLMILGATALCALAACGVDKEGTADKLVKDLEARDGITMTTEQRDCVKQVVTSMSEDEITAISEGKADADSMAEFGTSVSACISTPVAEEADGEAEVADELGDEEIVEEEADAEGTEEG